MFILWQLCESEVTGCSNQVSIFFPIWCKVLLYIPPCPWIYYVDQACLQSTLLLLIHSSAEVTAPFLQQNSLHIQLWKSWKFCFGSLFQDWVEPFFLGPQQGVYHGRECVASSAIYLLALDEREKKGWGQVLTPFQAVSPFAGSHSTPHILKFVTPFKSFKWKLELEHLNLEGHLSSKDPNYSITSMWLLFLLVSFRVTSSLWVTVLFLRTQRSHLKISFAYCNNKVIFSMEQDDLQWDD